MPHMPLIRRCSLPSRLVYCWERKRTIACAAVILTVDDMPLVPFSIVRSGRRTAAGAPVHPLVDVAPRGRAAVLGISPGRAHPAVGGIVGWLHRAGGFVSGQHVQVIAG